jgi:hypothetical protein
MTNVWQYSKAAGTDLLVLLALANIADDNGECWPSMSYIGHKARLSPRNARARIASLRDLGEVIVIKNGGKASSKGGLRSSLYQITVHMPAADTDASDRITSSDTDASDLQIRSLATGLIRMPATADTSLDTSMKQNLATTSSPPGDNCDVDPLRESVLEVCGWEPSSITSSALGSLNKAVRDLRGVGATAEDVYTRANRYQAQWSAVLTPMALAKHWASLGEDSTNANASNSELTEDPLAQFVRYGEKYAGKDADAFQSLLRNQPNLTDDQIESMWSGWHDAQPALVGS